MAPAASAQRILTQSPEVLPISDGQNVYSFSSPYSLSRLHVVEGVLKTGSVSGLHYDQVSMMRIVGDHTARFPREGMSFEKQGERPIESTAVEKYPQQLWLKGGELEPTYRVRDMDIDLEKRTASGIIESSSMRVRGPTEFSIRAEYVSPEEAALLESMGSPVVRYSKDVNTKHYFAGLFGLEGALAVNGLVNFGFSHALPTIVYVAASLSPDVTMKFPDGSVDNDTGVQVMMYEGTVHDPKGQIETQHFGGEEIISVPDKVTIEGVMEVAGLHLDGNSTREFAGTLEGVIKRRGDGQILMGGKMSEMPQHTGFLN